MSTNFPTEYTSQHILNEAKDATYGTIDTTPYLETTVGSVAQRATATVVGAKVAQDVSIAAGTALIGKVDLDKVAGESVQVAGGTEAKSIRVTIATDSTGLLSVDDNGSSLTVDNGGTFAVQAALAPATSGGLTIFRSIDLDESEEDVKTSAGQLYGWYLFNAHTATLYVKLYNATAANTTVGTTTPIMTIPVPAGSAANVEFTNGIAFGTALCAACTTGVADNDTGAPAANVLIANLFYK